MWATQLGSPFFVITAEQDCEIRGHLCANHCLVLSLPQRPDQIGPALNRNSKLRGNLTEFVQGMGITATDQPDLVVLRPRRNRLIRLRRVSAIRSLNNSAQSFFQQGNVRGSAGSAGMGSDCNTASGLHCCQYCFSRKPDREFFKRAKEKKINPLGSIFHADKDTETVFLHAFFDQVSSGHGIMIRDADPVQPLGLGIIEDLLQGQLTTGGEYGMNMEIEFHPPNIFHSGGNVNPFFNTGRGTRLIT